MGRRGGRVEKRRGENREQRIGEEGSGKKIQRNGEDTVRCEEDGEEGGRLEKRRVTENRG